MKNQTQIPWAEPEEWRQVIMSVKQIDMQYKKQLVSTRESAAGIRQAYGRMSGILDGICAATCKACRDICCARATIWFDFRDLLYLYFSTEQFPLAQIGKTGEKKGETACCHFSANGCTLERIKRPFVCTWYFCPAQTKIMSHYPEKKQLIDAYLKQIKIWRKKIEQDIIRISSGKA